VALN
jgi:hypothetical protein